MSRDDQPLVSAERFDRTVRLTIQNPPANLLSLGAMESLLDHLDGARDDRSIRVIIIAAAGKLFSAGHDLKEMSAHRGDLDKGRSFFEATFALCSRLMQAIIDHPKPVIAEVDGVATAAGCQLVASCDLAVASDRSKFGVNGIDVGLFCSTPAVALTRSISAKRAMEMLLTGEMIGAATALDFGLVNRVVPADAVRQTTSQLANSISAKSADAIALGKNAVRAQASLDIADACQCASRAMVENMLAADAEEGISAFIEKRTPEWRQ